MAKGDEDLARELYEAARRRVSGRPAWDKLDPNCPYDMGMRATAIRQARLKRSEERRAQESVAG